jgi:octanoyl-[GcvH]:protein N-octanoyltransferase
VTGRIEYFELAHEGVAAENEMLERAAPDLLVWEARRPSLVVPKRIAGMPLFRTAAASSRRRGWPVEVRSSGGGTVPQGPGIVNLAMTWLRGPGASVERSYARVVAPIAATLNDLGLEPRVGATPGSFCDGLHNVMVEGRKVAGTAQRWSGSRGRAVVLAHALVMVAPDLCSAVAAVSAFQRDLGAPEAIDVDAHTSIARALGPVAARTQTRNIGCTLLAHARRDPVLCPFHIKDQVAGCATAPAHAV